MSERVLRGRVSADTDVCIGSGNCPLVAPRVFDLDPDVGVVILLTEQVTGDDLAAARVAASQCPSGALEVHDDS